MQPLQMEMCYADHVAAVRNLVTNPVGSRYTTLELSEEGWMSHAQTYRAAKCALLPAACI